MRFSGEGANVSFLVSRMRTYQTLTYLSTAEERQEQNAKRRKIEKEMGSNGTSVGPSASLNLTAAPTAPASLPSRPDFAAKADSIGLGGPKTAETESFAATAAQAFAGSNSDIVKNRFAIRRANMSAAEILKAEMASLVPVKASRSSTTSSSAAAAPPPSAPSVEPASAPSAPSITPGTSTDDVEIPGLGGLSSATTIPTLTSEAPVSVPPVESGIDSIDGEEIPAEAEAEDSLMTDGSGPRGVKRSLDEAEAEDVEAEAEADETVDLGPDDEEEAPADTVYALKVNADGTVDQEDTVKCVNCHRTIESITLTSLHMIDCGSRATGSDTTSRSLGASTATLRSGKSEFTNGGSMRT